MRSVSSHDRGMECGGSAVPKLRCGMDDLLLLPDELRRQSLSDREIVLPYDAAVRAVLALQRAGCAVIGWEGWLLLHDRRRTHSRFQGTTDLVREEAESWPTFVDRSAAFCLRTMAEDWATFPASAEAARGQLFFCLSVAEPLPIDTGGFTVPGA